MIKNIICLFALMFANPVLGQVNSISPSQLLERLSYAPGKARVVIDTDAFNEIDDQFAVVYAALSPEKMHIEAIYAAPFINKRASSVADGMEKSYQEIHNVLDKIGKRDQFTVLRGSTHFLSDKSTPVVSPAAQDLVARARQSSEPLFVLALGAPTNVASALLLDPEIRNHIVVVWLGGKAPHWRTAREYNLHQDPFASQILFDSGVPLVQIPTEPVSSHLSTTLAELKATIGGANRISDYLVSIFEGYSKDHFGWSKVIWDISVIAYIINPDWLQYEVRATPLLNLELTYSHDGTRHLYKVATHIDRNKVFRDMFRKLKDFKE